MISVACRQVLTRIMPRRVLARVKRQMRRDTRKPKNMKVRPHYQRLLRHNMEYLPNLPPFGANQSLSTDEMMDILLYGTPKSWQKEMERQGFDPMVSSTNQVVEFMEQIEATEDFEPDKPAAKQQSSPKKNNNQKKPPASGNGKKPAPGSLYCLLHGKCSHTTDECDKLQEQAKRLKTETYGNGNGTKKSFNNTNKTWSRKAQDSEKSTKSDLAAFVKKEVKKTAKQFAAKKRKSSDESDDDLAAFDLKDFNYDDMDNLKIDSDDEFSA